MGLRLVALNPTCSFLREKHPFAIITQLVDRFFDVFQCAMGLPFLVHRKGWVPSFDKLFDGAYIDVSVMQKFLQGGHISFQESTILSNGIAAEGRFLFPAVLRKEFEG